MTAAAPRLVALVCAFTSISALSFWVVRHSFGAPRGKDAVTLGLEWLRHEYELDKDTFVRVIEVHRSYLEACRQRCNDLGGAERRFLGGVLRSHSWSSDLAAARRFEESICHDCRIAMIEHVHAVASLMPEKSGRRFLLEANAILQPHPPPLGASDRPR